MAVGPPLRCALPLSGGSTPNLPEGLGAEGKKGESSRYPPLSKFRGAFASGQHRRGVHSEIAQPAREHRSGPDEVRQAPRLRRAPGPDVERALFASAQVCCVRVTGNINLYVSSSSVLELGMESSIGLLSVILSLYPGKDIWRGPRTGC